MTECYRNNIFIHKPEIWAGCESGQGKDGCEIFQGKNKVSAKRTRIQRIEEDMNSQKELLDQLKRELAKDELITKKH